MRKGVGLLGTVAILALVALAGVSIDPVYATCVSPDRNYDINQCGGTSWTAPIPPGGGTLQKVVWWQVGFGNNTKTQPGSGQTGESGTGWVPGVCTANVCSSGLVGQACTTAANCLLGFVGNDSGRRPLDPAVPLSGLSSATIIGGPPGSFCFDGANTWGASGPTGVDGCGDNAHTGTTQVIDYNTQAPCGGVKNDNSINKYYGPCYLGPGNDVNPAYQLDHPMGALFTETSGKYFALAFFASASRNQDHTDTSPGSWRMNPIGGGATNKGDHNPVVAGQDNIVPWQSIPGFRPSPDPLVCDTLAGSCRSGRVGRGCATNGDCASQASASAQLSDPLNPASLRNVSLTWDAVRVIDDGSIRPSPDTTLGPGITGVGVRDQGILVRHQVEIAPVLDAAGTCGTFTDLANGATTGNSISFSSPTGVIPPDRCLRLRTNFGRNPATTTATLPNASNALLGDIGYQVVSEPLLIGGQLVKNDNAILQVATRNKNALLVRFQTPAETSVTGFEILGKDQKGAAVVLGTQNCTECTTGRGASYEVLIPSGQSKGTKSVQIRTLPNGSLSNEVSLR